ncbi:hypothetical protein GN316_15215 [Xylophilus sp. Kf1]|nr:hypothetical protein [Xylophilus sp. Kf1]
MLTPRKSRRMRLIVNSIVFIILWLIELGLVISGGPFGLIITFGVLGAYFALCDWREVRTLSHNKVMQPQPDPDVQELINGNIGITEYRKRKEAKADACRRPEADIGKQL